MKEAKRTPVPLPGKKAQSTAKSNAPKPQLSQEFIDSGDESPNEKAVYKPKTTIAIHKPNGAAKPKAKPSTKLHAPSNSTTKPKSPKKATPKQVIAVSQAADSSSSEQSEESESSTSNVPRKQSGAEDTVDSPTQSDSDSESDSSSNDVAANTAAKPGRSSTQQTIRSSNGQSHAVEFQAEKAYVPPRGFNSVPMNDKTMSKSSSIFGNLQGKQVWHITAPAGVSVKDLKMLAMDKALTGEAILNYKGTDYGFAKTKKGEEVAREVLVPQDVGYQSVPAKISQTLHLQAVVRLPELSSVQETSNTGSETAASITRSTIRAPRPQVKGLKMRFLPSGFGGDAISTLGDSDSEGERPRDAAGPEASNEVSLPYRKEKRKHIEVNGTETAPSSKKSKKQRPPEEIKRKEERRAKKEKKRAQVAALKAS